MAREYISYIIDWLIKKHFILNTNGLYLALHLHTMDSITLKK